MQHSLIKSNLERHHKDCYGWAVHCCDQDKDMAYEVLQDAYLKILERHDSFMQKSEFKTWAFAIIKNTAFDARRKIRKEAMILTGEYDFTAAGYEAGFEKEFDQELTKGFFSEALSRLSDRQRQILQLVFYHELSLNQTAEVLHLSQGSVRKYYDRAKKVLAGWFQKRGIVEV